MLTIQGVHNYNPRDLADALIFLERHQGQFPFADLVSESYRLEDVNEAIDAAKRSGALRVAVCPQSV